MPTEPLFRDDAYLTTASARVIAVHDRGVELDRTIFYPLGGGQLGDVGSLLRENGERIAIIDTRKGETPGTVLHVTGPGAPRPGPGELLSLEIDWPRRYALMRLHTALHVMSCVVVAPVTGGNIAPDKARLDFDIDMSLLDTGSRQDHERETAARQRARPPAAHSGHRPAALRRHARAQHRRDRQHPRAEDPQRRQAQQARGDRAHAVIPRTGIRRFCDAGTGV